MPQDRILNPLDARAIAWSPLSEMREGMDATRIAHSLVPDPPAAGDEAWYGYARQLLAAALVSVWERDGTNGELFDLLTLAAREADLRAACEHSPASTLFLEGNHKMRANAQGVLGPHLTALSYLPRDAGTSSFSFRQWAAGSYSHAQAEWLWWPVKISHLSALHSLISAQLAEAIASILDLPEDHGRRIFLLVDELGQLGRIQALEQALTLGRKNGLSAILAAQSVAQLRKLYGPEGAQILLSCLSSWIIMRAADAETAEAMSRHVGDREVRLTERSEGESGSYIDGRSQRSRSTTLTDQRRVERVYLPSQIQRLPDRQAIVTLAGHAEAVPVRIPLISPSLRHVAQGFISRPHKKPPAPEGRTPTPAAPVSGGAERGSPASKTTPANAPSTAQAGASSTPPASRMIALDDLVTREHTATRTSQPPSSNSRHQAGAA